VEVELGAGGGGDEALFSNPAPAIAVCANSVPNTVAELRKHLAFMARVL
jgi:hypothetical protein